MQSAHLFVYGTFCHRLLKEQIKVNYLHQRKHNREKSWHWIIKGLGWENHTHPLFKILLIYWKRKGQKKCQYEEDSTCYRIEILEVMFPKCSQPNVWYDLVILTTATEVHDRAPELLTLPFFSPLQTKLQKRLTQELNIMCNCVRNTNSYQCTLYHWACVC